MSRQKSQAGFGAVEILLIIVVLVVVGAGSWYVLTHKKDDKKKSATTSQTQTTEKKSTAGTVGSEMCMLGETMGHPYTDPTSSYSVCLPDGWRFMINSEDVPNYVALYTTSSVYKSGTLPFVESFTGGKDGIIPAILLIIGGTDDTSSLPQVGVIDAQNASGTVYYEVTTSEDNGMLGSVPKGTAKYSYDFTKGNKSIGVSYYHSPGEPDDTVLMRQVAESLKFL